MGCVAGLALILILFLVLGPTNLSGLISQEEREAFYKERGYWPDW